MNPAASPGAHDRGVFKYELALLLVSIIWGTTFVAQQIGMEKGLGPMTFNGLRFALGAVSLVPVMIWRRKRRPSGESAVRPPFRWCLGAGLLLFAAAALQQIGLLYTSSAHSGFITGFYILFVPLLGLFLGHRAPRSLWLGVTVCLAGFYLLSVTGGFVVSKGDWLTLVCAVLWAGQILVIDHIAGKGDPVGIAYIQFVVCAVLSMICGLLFEGWSLEKARAASGAIAYAGFLSVAVAYTLQVVCQKRCPPAPASIIMSLEAVFAAIAGYLVLNQTLTLRAMAGCLLILAGVLTVQLAPMLRRRKSA